MTFHYTSSLVRAGLTYAAYKQYLNDSLAKPPADHNEAKLRPHVHENVVLMNVYDETYVVSGSLKKNIEAGPDLTWLVITEGWCSDAAFSVPMMAAIERAVPGKVQLRIFLRDANPELIDANLTEGVRSIPKLIVLDSDLQKVASWGPRPAVLTAQFTAWKEEGLTLKQIILKLHYWYDEDATRCLQEELELMIAMLPVHGMK